ncbi:hypothetical protein VOLCADRAFT_85767 [Volvox carteri f. nagariensis]|uniref:Sulfite exporter TauE/SafE n=1 Tax=Volvox carteri f. nagariensis TaxID=3068 RepID=D8TGX6_VOLCA|nr:uncharacterized protein VOLCADRAFT_85767 [Volvox carteri f. nagariensis]EFJ52610.1 hypothetical protein VOLCADRAFT_85767 [Volvox carteri f. nagariensis]|eukprot:XP_002945615.1 hypothetical protein VOLCADRAFT_85767 [Volvox carteri f. nagariensis]
MTETRYADALKPSTALSQACITASSLAAVVSNLPRTHPSVPEAPLIDFPLILLLTPVLLVGVGIGVLLNVALPSWLLNLLLLVLLLLLLAQAIAKGKALWAQESKRAQAAAAAAAARHDTSNKSGDHGGSSSRGGSREGLLAVDHPYSSCHSAATSIGAAGSSGLRLRRVQSYSNPRGPWGLEPNQYVSLSCFEGLEITEATTVAPYGPAGPAAAAAIGSGGGGGSATAATAAVARRSPADVSWDCMEGVSVTGENGPTHDHSQHPSYARRSSSIFPATAFSKTSSFMGGDDVGIGRYGAGPGSSATPGGASPVSSLYAPSWRAFNELGALDFDTDMEEVSCDVGEGAGAAGGGGRPQFNRRSTRHSGYGSPSSPMLMAPTAGMLVTQLMRLSPSVATAVAAVKRRHKRTRRSSFDPATGLIDFSTAVMGPPDEETGAAEDSWLQRRSKWRSRLPSGAQPHRGSLRGSLLLTRSIYPHSAAYPLSGIMQPPPSVASSGASARISGSGLSQFQRRSLRQTDGGGGDDGGAGSNGMEQPFSGAMLEGSSDRPYSAMPDLRSEYGGAAPVAAGDGCGFTATDACRVPARLETLPEEVDDKGEFRYSTSASPGSRSGPAAGSEMAGPEAMQTPCAAVFAKGYVSQAPGLGPSCSTQAGCDAAMWPGVPATPTVCLILYDRHNTQPSSMSSSGQCEYVRIECGPAIVTEADRRHRGGEWHRSVGSAAGAAMGAARKWADDWAAAMRRIPRRFAVGLIIAWGTYLALQGARATMTHCSPAWWITFIMQAAAMLGISAIALVMVIAALAKSAEASDVEAAAGDVGMERREGMTEGTAAKGAQRPDGEGMAAPAAAVAAAGAVAVAEPALGGTAALLVLEAPVKTLCATFGAGLTGGLLGLGGGMVMGPLLLQIGVHPQVTAASSGAMVLFSSSAALIQFVLLHRLNTDYALVFGAASLVAGLVGTQTVSGAIKRSGRPSIVVLALAGVMGIGTVCVAAFGLRNAAGQLRRGDLGFAGICSSHGGK